jgi:hypothetical protein
VALSCPAWPFRMGANPWRAPLSDAERLGAGISWPGSVKSREIHPSPRNRGGLRQKCLPPLYLYPSPRGPHHDREITGPDHPCQRYGYADAGSAAANTPILARDRVLVRVRAPPAQNFPGSKFPPPPRDLDHPRSGTRRQSPDRDAVLAVTECTKASAVPKRRAFSDGAEAILRRRAGEASGRDSISVRACAMDETGLYRRGRVGGVSSLCPSPSRGRLNIVVQGILSAMSNKAVK